MKPKEFFLSLNKNGIPDEAWNYLQTEIIPDSQLEELTEISPYFREVAKALNTFYPDSLSESIKLNLKSILETTEPKPEREPEPEPEPIEDVTLPEPAPEPAKPKTSKKEVKAAVKALTTALKYAKDKKKFNSIKGAIKALGLQMKYMKDGGSMEKGNDKGIEISLDKVREIVILLKKRGIGAESSELEKFYNIYGEYTMQEIFEKNQQRKTPEQIHSEIKDKNVKDGGSMEKGGKVNFAGHTFKINEQGVVKEIRNFYTQKMVKEFNLNGVIYTKNHAYKHYTSPTNEILQKFHISKNITDGK